MVANSAQRRSGKELIANTVLAAYGVKVLEHLQQERLVRGHVLYNLHARISYVCACRGVHMSETLAPTVAARASRHHGKSPSDTWPI
jgi:hypothetical protein